MIVLQRATKWLVSFGLIIKTNIRKLAILCLGTYWRVEVICNQVTRRSLDRLGVEHSTAIFAYVDNVFR